MHAIRRSILIGCVVLLSLALGAPDGTASADAGDLDPTFGSDGKVITTIAGGAQCSALALQEDGKLLVAGRVSGSGGHDFLLVRYNPDGSLDTSFGANGVVETDFLGTDDEANAVVVQQDGKIVVAGSMSTPDFDFAVARYNPDGSLDPTFGRGGKVVTGMDGQDVARALVIQPDGKVVAAGYSYQGWYGDARIALARYTSQGMLDFAFLNGSKVVTPASDGGSIANAVALQADGSILVAGSAGHTSSANDASVMVARFGREGALDATFGTGGVVTTTLTGPYDAAYGMVVQDGGKIVVAGRAGYLPILDVAVLRYNPDGSLDPDFGSGGKVITDISGSDDTAQAIALQPDGKLLVAGRASWRYPNGDFALLRYTETGALDKTFGFDGIVSTDFGGGASASGLVIQPDGRIVVAGTVGDRLGLARYQASPPKMPRQGWLPVIWVQ